MKVKDIMTEPAIVVGEGSTLEQVARMMVEQRIGCLPVVDADGNITGVITEANLFAKNGCVPFSQYRLPQLFGVWMGDAGLEEIYREASSISAREIMTAPAITAQEDDSIESLVETMLHHKIKHLPVVREGKPIGM
ncbi:MAG: CBS domain-containing protein, partial [Acidobacteria bacterium]|nr:CBS domain-containing protein [Acidobacteriota bacterium]